MKKKLKSLKKRVAWGFIIALAALVLFCGIGNSQEFLSLPIVPPNFGGAVLAPATVESLIREDDYIGAIPDIKPANFYVVPRDIETSA